MFSTSATPSAPVARPSPTMTSSLGMTVSTSSIELSPRTAVEPNAAAPPSDVRTWMTLPLAQSLTLRSEEHTSELPSLMRSSYAVFCLKNIKDLMKVHSSEHYNQVEQTKVRHME